MKMKTKTYFSVAALLLLGLSYSFKASAVEDTCGDPITDRDGFTYKTVHIGDQCWLGENLRTKSKPNGSCINGGSTPVIGQFYLMLVFQGQQGT